MARSADPQLARLAATHVVRVLKDAGHVAYFAGGCVRDALLSLHPTDFDVATDAVPQRVRALFPRTQEVGESFGVVLVPVRASEVSQPHHPPHQPRSSPEPKAVVEVATFRSDGPYHDARRPEHVTFSDPENDAQRRDFTINALFLDPLAPSDDSLPAGSDVRGRIIDFVGGLADLRARVLRAVGDPDKRLQEDHLRALRAVRFTARLGFALDPATAQAITRHAAQLTGVSRERIGDELRRMLAHPSAAKALALIQQLRLDAPVLGGPHADPPLSLVSALAPPCVPMTMLAAWLFDRHPAAGPNEIRTIAARTRSSLCLSNDESDLLTGILLTTHDLAGWSSLTVAARKRMAYRTVFPEAVAIVAVQDAALASDIHKDVHRLASDGIGIHPNPLVSGDDLVREGLTPGPLFKKALDEAYDAQLEGRVRDRAAAMELARRFCV